MALGLKFGRGPGIGLFPLPSQGSYIRSLSKLVSSLAPTYSRATSAWNPATNSIAGAGVKRTRMAPTFGMMDEDVLIEGARTNLLAAGTSERFSLWTQTNAPTVTDGVAGAPDGTATATTIQDSSAVAYQGVSQSFTVAVDSLSHYFSISVKKTTGGTAPIFGINLAISGGTTVNSGIRVNTDTGAQAYSNNANASVVSAGVYWRVTIKITNNSTALNTALAVTVYPATAPAGGVADSVAATGTATVAWSLMEKAEFPSSYISNRNLLVQSNTLSDASWTRITTTQTQNGATLPSGSVGWTIATTAAANCTQRQTIVTVPGVTYVVSWWAKAGTLTDCAYAAYNATGGAFIVSQTNYFSSLNGSTYTRVSFTFTAPAGCISTYVYPYLQLSSQGTIVMGDVQCEPGTTATTYWATTTAVGLREADSLTCSLASITAAGTNLLTYSEQQDNAAWTKTRCTVTANATTDPNGNSYADKLVEDTSVTQTHFAASSGISTTNGLAYTCSFYAKAAERTWVALGISSTILTGGGTAFFDIGTGALGNVVGTISSAIVSVGSGWYRVSVTFTATATAAASMFIYIAQSSGVVTYTGDGASGLYVIGAQAVQASAVNTYLPTGATAVTAAQTGLSTTAGTILAVCQPYGWTGDQDGSTNWNVIRFNDTQPSRFSRAGATLLGLVRGDAGGAETANVTHSLTDGVNRVIAMAYDAISVRGYVAGVLAATGATLTAPYDSGATTLTIGSVGGTAQHFYGWVRVYVINDRALTADGNLAFANGIRP